MKSRLQSVNKSDLSTENPPFLPARSCELPAMTVTRIAETSHTVLVLNGRLDNATSPLLDEEFDTLYARGVRKFVWDCSGLEYISSAGLRSFLQAMKKLDDDDSRLVVASVPPALMEIFDMAGFKSLLTIAPDRASAARHVA